MSEHPTNNDAGLYGLMAEFRDTTAIVAAARSAHEAGYRRVDAYTPFRVSSFRVYRR